MHILIIEDDPNLNQSLCNLLTKRGYTTVPARSEQEARKTLKKDGGTIAIALVDMFLPVKAGNTDDKESGLRLIRLMTRRYPSIVKLVFTGHADLANADRCMQAGAFSYCAKGGEPDALLEKIKQAVVKFQREQLLRRGVRDMRKEVEEVQNRLTNLIGTIQRLSDEVEEASDDDAKPRVETEGNHVV